MEVVGEYVEPGKSGMTVDGWPKFLEMMARIRNEKDVGAIIVYARSRMLEPLVVATRSRAEATRGKTKGPLGGPACFDKTKLAGLLETYGHALPQVQALHQRLTAPLTSETDSAAKGRR